MGAWIILFKILGLIFWLAAVPFCMGLTLMPHLKKNCGRRGLPLCRGIF